MVRIIRPTLKHKVIIVLRLFKDLRALPRAIALWVGLGILKELKRYSLSYVMNFSNLRDFAKERILFVGSSTFVRYLKFKGPYKSEGYPFLGSSTFIRSLNFKGHDKSEVYIFLGSSTFVTSLKFKAKFLGGGGGGGILPLFYEGYIEIYGAL